MTIKSDLVVDAKGLSCPMPIVKAKKGMEQIEPGQVMELQATDRGSLADIQGWAKGTGHQYLGSTEEGDLLKHYLRKANPNEMKEEVKYEHVIRNEELAAKMDQNEPLVVLDVRESAEYAFQHIPGAVSIPLGELESRIGELKKDDQFYVICRTGNRSDIACKTLADHGFEHVANVVPGMSEWTGRVEKEV